MEETGEVVVVTGFWLLSVTSSYTSSFPGRVTYKRNKIILFSMASKIEEKHDGSNEKPMLF